MVSFLLVMGGKGIFLGKEMLPEHGVKLKGASLTLCLALGYLSWPRKACLKLLGFDLLLWVFPYRWRN